MWRARHGLGDADGSAERQPEDAEPVGHADREMNGQRGGRHQPPVEPRPGDDPLPRQNPAIASSPRLGFGLRCAECRLQAYRRAGRSRARRDHASLSQCRPSRWSGLLLGPMLAASKPPALAHGLRPRLDHRRQRGSHGATWRWRLTRTPERGRRLRPAQWLSGRRRSDRRAARLDRHLALAQRRLDRAAQPGGDGRSGKSFPTEGGRPAFTNAMTRMVTAGSRPARPTTPPSRPMRRAGTGSCAGSRATPLKGEWLGLRVDPEREDGRAW